MENSTTFRQWKYWFVITLLAIVETSYSLRGPWVYRILSCIVLAFLCDQTYLAYRKSRKSVNDLLTEALSRLPLVYIQMRNGSKVSGPLAKVTNKKCVFVHVEKPFYFEECKTVVMTDHSGKQTNLSPEADN